MAFWTSSNPGVLPKWVFWLFAIWTPIDLVLTVAEAVDTDSSPRLFGVFVMGWCAWLAHKNEVRALVWVNAIAATASFVFAFFWTNVTQLPSELVPAGYEYVTSTYFVFVGVISLIFALYLNRYRVKGVAPQLNKSDRRNATAKSYAPSSAPIKGTEQDEEQLAERGIFDIQHSGTPEEASPDDYATELSLFEAGDLDQSLWAKHLVEAEGDADKAKWQYIKARVKTAPARRAEQEKEKKEAEMRAFSEAERLKEERLAAERNITVLMVTHHLGDARSIANKFVFVALGKVLVEDSIEVLTAEHPQPELSSFVKAGE